MAGRRQGRCGTCGRELPTRTPGKPGADLVYCPHPDGGRKRSKCQRFACLSAELKSLAYTIESETTSSNRMRAHTRMKRTVKDILTGLTEAFLVPR